MRSISRFRFNRATVSRFYSLSPLSPIEPDRPKTDNPFSDPALKNDTYLHNYLSKVAYTTAAGLGGTALAASAILTSVDVTQYSMPLFGGSVLAMLGKLYFFLK